MNIKILFLIFLFIMVGVWGQSRKLSNAPSPEVSHLPERVAEVDPQLTEHSSRLPLSPLQLPPPVTHLETRFAAPTSESLREQVRENPHEPSLAFLAFASRLAPEIERGLADKHEGELVFHELARCIQKNENPLVVRALCLKNANLLSKKHSVLLPEFQHLFSEADAALIDLL